MLSRIQRDRTTSTRAKLPRRTTHIAPKHPGEMRLVVIAELLDNVSHTGACDDHAGRNPYPLDLRHGASGQAGRSPKPALQRTAAQLGSLAA